MHQAKVAFRERSKSWRETLTRTIEEKRYYYNKLYSKNKYTLLKIFLLIIGEGKRVLFCYF